MGRISIVIAASILLSPSAQAQGTDACAIVNEFGLRRWSDQFKAEVGKCETAKTAVVRSRDVSKGVSGKPPSAKPAASPVVAYSGNGDARPRAIYVRDDRIEAEALGKIIHPRLQALRKAVRATGALVDSDRIEASGSGFRLKLKSYAEEYGTKLCDGEAFAKGKVGAFCTVFLVGPKLIATAGHCVKGRPINEAEPAKTSFKVLFGFETKNGVERETYIKDEVYEAVHLVERFLEGGGDQLRDFALLELDREVPSQIAEPLRLAGPARMQVDADTPLGVIGHPDGLAKKVSFASDVTKTDVSRAMESGPGNIFRAQLNTFHGNSGSPVIFYDQPDVVAGILVQGENDYILVAGEPDKNRTPGDTDPRLPFEQCKKTAIFKTAEMCGQDGVRARCSEKVTKSVLIEPYVAE